MGPPANHGDPRIVPLVPLGQRGCHAEIFPKHTNMNDPATSDSFNLRSLLREPVDTYHAKAKDHLSSHALAEFRRCPLLFRKKELGLIPSRDSHAFVVGRAAHVLILEGRERYEAEFAVGGPINTKTGLPFGSATKAFMEWATQRGRPVLADDDAATVEEMAASVTSHAVANALLADGVAEGVVRAKYAGHASQARIDWINPAGGAGIVDLKTCDRMDSFEFDARAFNYIHQLAFYRAVLEVATDVALPVHIIAVEKREPFRSGVWHIAPAVLDAAKRENEAAMASLSECRASGIWPTGFEAMRQFDHN